MGSSDRSASSLAVEAAAVAAAAELRWRSNLETSIVDDVCWLTGHCLLAPPPVADDEEAGQDACRTTAWRETARRQSVFMVATGVADACGDCCWFFTALYRIDGSLSPRLAFAVSQAVTSQNWQQNGPRKTNLFSAKAAAVVAMCTAIWT